MPGGWPTPNRPRSRIGLSVGHRFRRRPHTVRERPPVSGQLQPCLDERRDRVGARREHGGLKQTLGRRDAEVVADIEHVEGQHHVQRRCLDADVEETERNRMCRRRHRDAGDEAKVNNASRLIILSFPRESANGSAMPSTRGRRL